MDPKEVPTPSRPFIGRHPSYLVLCTQFLYKTTVVRHWNFECRTEIQETSYFDHYNDNNCSVKTEVRRLNKRQRKY